jgi:hypothetical protein
MGSRVAAGVRGNPVLACLAVAVACSAALTLGLASQLTFVADDWGLLLERRGSSIDVYLDPFNEHIIFIPVAIYKLLLSTFGMDSALPFHVVAISVFLLSAVLLFVHLRSRVGDWLALLAAVLILFLGAAFENLLWTAAIVQFGSMAAGVGMLIAFDRDDEQGDWIACVLLAVSLAFSSIGLAFAIGALVDLALSRRPRIGRAYVAFLPLALYALWWLGWGHGAESHLSWDNVANTPEFVINAAAAGITSLLGLATGDGSEPDQPGLIWGQIAIVAALALAAFRISRGARVSRDLAIVLAIAIGFWTLVALNKTIERFPTSSRYQYPSAILLLLIAGELLRGVRIGRGAIVAGAVVTAASVMGGLSLLHQEYSERWKTADDYLRASLTAIEMARDSVDPKFVMSFPPSVEVSSKTYLSAVDDHGSPALSESELLTKDEPYRATADVTLSEALGLALVPAVVRGAAGCQTVQASPGGYTGLTLAPGDYTLMSESTTDVEVRLGRFSDGLPVDLGVVAAGSDASLGIPTDRSVQPWRLGLDGEGPVRVC